jgi:hypothetical protein
MWYKAAKGGYKMTINISEYRTRYTCFSVIMESSINIKFDISWLRFRPSRLFSTPA